jgi:hypothetical protein
MFVAQRKIDINWMSDTSYQQYNECLLLHVQVRQIEIMKIVFSTFEG